MRSCSYRTCLRWQARWHMGYESHELYYPRHQSIGCSDLQCRLFRDKGLSSPHTKQLQHLHLMSRPQQIPAANPSQLIGLHTQRMGTMQNLHSHRRYSAVYIPRQSILILQYARNTHAIWSEMQDPPHPARYILGARTLLMYSKHSACLADVIHVGLHVDCPLVP